MVGEVAKGRRNPGGVSVVLSPMEEAISIAESSIAASTKKLYKIWWNKFVLFATEAGCDASLYNCTHLLVVLFFLSIFQKSNSIASVLSARAAIHFYWSIYSTCPTSPTSHLFVTRFIKGLSKTKPKSSVKKAYAINYSEIESVIKSICNGILYENLTFLDQRFIVQLT